MKELLTFDTAQAGLLLLILLVGGDWLSKKLKGKLPSVLLAGLAFMLLSWAGVIPDTLLATSGFSGLTAICTGLIITGMGASMSIRTFAANWRVVVLAMGTYVLQAVVILLVLSLLLGFNTAIGALPGGSMTALIIQQRAAQLGLDDTIVLSVLYFSTQVIVASLLASHHIKKEAQRLLAQPHEAAAATETQDARSKAIPFFDQSNFGALCKLYLIAWLASKAGALTGINQFILCMIFGVLAAHLGFVDKQTVSRSGTESFFFFVLMATIITGFAKATPAMFAQMLGPLLLVFALQILVTYLATPLLGRLLGFSRDMSVALGSNVMMGFPTNMILADEVAGHLTQDPAEREYLSRQIASRMVIAGLSTTTTLAVFTGGLLVNFMG